VLLETQAKRWPGFYVLS